MDTLELVVAIVGACKLTDVLEIDEYHLMRMNE